MRSKSIIKPAALPSKRSAEASKSISKTDTIIEAEAQVSPQPKPAPVFPVKSVLKASLCYHSHSRVYAMDKENIKPINWDDLDAEDSGDPMMVSDYVVEIFDYMKKLEVN